jgi:hypothetical protein
MFRRRTLAVTFACAGLFFAGCAETPHQPTLRPIPPPPSAPPPGASYLPGPRVVVITNGQIPPTTSPTETTTVTNAIPNAPVAGPAPQGNYEVTTNFAPNASTTLQNAPGAPPQSVPSAVTSDSGGIPQYEVVPERPSPDYVWVDGNWSWQGRWVWSPGRWVWQPHPHVIVTPGFYWGPSYYYGPRYYHHHHY